MKWYAVILTCLSFYVVAGDVQNVDEKEKNDLTQFDKPLLLGDWYYINPAPSEVGDDFLAVRLHLSSDYSFGIQITKVDHTTDLWVGKYNVSSSNIILGPGTADRQIYPYSVNHNQLLLDGVYFAKGYNTKLIGSWSSTSIKGDDILASKVSKMTITLRPDFVFMFYVESSDGNMAAYQGIYYFEGNHLVLVYENGQQDSTFTVDDDELLLTNEGYDMQTVLAKVE